MERPAWPAIATRLARELGEPLHCLGELGRPRDARTTWAADSETLGELVVKVRRGDRAEEKTARCVANLPRLGARGYPVPEIIWHGLLDGDWHVAVQRRLPGRPLRSVELLDAILALVELQADADIAAGERDFAEYQSLVLFKLGSRLARRRDRVARALCAVAALAGAGLGLPATDFANNDLNLSNILSDGETITGVVDWDEFGLNSRAVDLTALAFDCERLGADAATRTLLERVIEIAGAEGLRCAVSYRALGHLAALVRRRELESVDAVVAVATRILDRLDGARV